MEEQEIKKVKEVTEEFLAKMTLAYFSVEVTRLFAAGEVAKDLPAGRQEMVEVQITLQDPQMLIGHNGQTLFELSRILRIVLNKKLQKDFYVSVDINEYKKKNYNSSCNRSYVC